MLVELGNNAAKEGQRTEYSAADYKVGDLRDLAASRGIDPTGAPDLVAARLSSALDFVDLEPGQRVTTVRFPPSISLAEAFTAITNKTGVWAHHSSSPPTWVWSDSPGLQALLAEHFDCPAGRPDDVEATHHTQWGPPGVGPEEEVNQ